MTTPELWKAEMEAPLYVAKGNVSDKVAEQEFAMFLAAKEVLT